uniref:Uncharacterized protein n=1 Tax=Anguilla anguilla TaxID=7936 RepID=A0A0E9XFL3_ANGAN
MWVRLIGHRCNSLNLLRRVRARPKLLMVPGVGLQNEMMLVNCKCVILACHLD